MKHLVLSAVLFLVLVVGTASASRVIYPPGPYPEFNTPVMTNGFVGAPSNFSVTANFTVQYPGCTSYAAPGMLVISMTGWCHISDKYDLAKQGGAVGFIFSGFEVLGVGRISRVPISNTPLDIPAVIISYPDFLMLSDIANQTGSYATIEITPGVSEWHTTVGNTGWFITLNVIFGVFYVALLALVIYKFIRKVRASGFILNISFVYLFFQFVFCIMMIVRWIDPVLTWGIISHDADAFMDQWPATWSFAALVLMAFFWFEVINQFANTKVQPFLTKKMQIPFWILVAIIILLPAINSIIIGYASITELLLALLYIPFIAGMIVAAFYIVVAVKALQVIKRSERLNVDKKTRVRGLMRSRVSIIISTIIACIYPPCNFFLRYFIVSGNLYLALAALYEESLFLGIITFIQIWFMPDKSPGMSSTGSRTSTSLNSHKPKDDNTTTTINSTAEV